MSLTEKSQDVPHGLWMSHLILPHSSLLGVVHGCRTYKSNYSRRSPESRKSIKNRLIKSR